MADLLDMAAEQEENRLQGLLATRQRPAPAYSISETHCVECGTEIPAARRIAVPGCECCVECQGMREVRRG
ncbi:TraR/DksA C4-type zinc finger protein [Pseudomonas citronellolis]|uniref:TraR/DksA C4-type zinc finger protein n=1 Tax=Pseudomonas citronellolis TaxID=53408 RepID=UPI00226F891B|nr:TraR/DksA C4-type zinc finger protein [Pseudomonas citronellolis]WAB92499.1 TraR/DksA C4-type zinc finger protein [Pseudomonas citronellolis]